MTYCIMLLACIWLHDMRTAGVSADMHCGAKAADACEQSCVCVADETGHSLLVCTFFVVLLTVLFNGGASPWLMRVLALRAEDEDRRASSGPRKRLSDADRTKPRQMNRCPWTELGAHNFCNLCHA